MEAFGILLLLGLVAWVFVMPVVALIRSGRAKQETDVRIDVLQRHLAELERKVARLEEQRPEEIPGPGTQEPGVAPRPIVVLEPRKATPEARPIVPATPPVEAAALREARPLPATLAVPPPLPPEAVRPTATPAAAPLPRPAAPGPYPAPSAAPAAKPGWPAKGVDWEQFLGARLYAWIGGFALFLAVAYFVKYSFEQGWLPPELRVALGFVLGLGLLVTGVVLRRREYTITAQTLSATGILVLYGVTFACRAVYHFAFFGPVPTFALMTLITAVAFLVAVRMDAMVVAVLGMLGGFLTPVLLSTGQDAPIALFSYLGLLDAGLLALVWRRRWSILAPLAAAGTVILLVGWTTRFFAAGQYAEGARPLIPMAILVGFSLLWLLAARLVQRDGAPRPGLEESAVGMLFVAFVYGFYFQSYTALAERPWLLFTYLFVVDGLALALSVTHRRLELVFPAGGALVFAQLALWMSNRVTPELLPAALVFTLVFAVAHAGWPLARQRLARQGLLPPPWSLAIPALALVILLVPTFRLTVTPLALWPVILLIDVLAIGLAAASRSLLPVLATLVLTLVATVGSLLRIPAELTGLPSLLVVIGVCAVFFVAAGLWLARRAGGLPATSPELLKDPVPTALSPASISLHVALAAALPFVLLLLIVGRLPLANPSPVFGLALLLTGMLLGLSRMFRLPWLPVVALGSVAALEYVWHLRRFEPDAAVPALVWYLVFLAVFAVHPFIRRREVEELPGPWIGAALAGPVQFYLVHQVVRSAWPNPYLGLLAAAFAVPAFASLAAVLRGPLPATPNRPTQLALFGGAGLFFITLIFPLQFSRQWITVSWALEGAALCWLFHRVPHPGLRLTGVGLLITAFVRLALNPAVLSYHPRSDAPLLNWYLYTYGLAALAHFVAARLLAPPRDRVFQTNAPALLWTLGTILAFLLLNVEIADFFTAPGETVLTFQFSGNFARDMTYSIGWALFALVLLIIGMVRRLAPVRYAALVLLGVTILKLFLHDLARLATPYRIGALATVAVVALVASFLYQRFVAQPLRPDEDTPSQPTPQP